MSYFGDELNLDAATEERCLNDPLAARTRHALLKIEKEGHRAGWDSDSARRLFKLERHHEKNFLTIYPQQMLTDALRKNCQLVNGNVGRAMQHVAEAFEEATKILGAPKNDEDYAEGGPGQQIYGFALRDEIWVTPEVKPGERLDPELRAAVDEHRLHAHPNRVEGRMVMFTARDGLRWLVLRVRGKPPEVVVTMPEGDYQFGGNIGNALSRMTASLANNAVPLIGVKP